MRPISHRQHAYREGGESRKGGEGMCTHSEECTHTHAPITHCPPRSSCAQPVLDIHAHPSPLSLSPSPPPPPPSTPLLTHHPLTHTHTPPSPFPRPTPGNLNYGRFKRNNFNICSKSWNYRGCWHQTCPLLAFSVVSVHRSFYGTDKAAPLVLLVTTSDVVDWVVCAPAAFLRSMKHVSCSFSGVEPKSSVTRHHHRSPLYYG